jgi:phosphate-selective porin OprO/OprP
MMPVTSGVRFATCLLVGLSIVGSTTAQESRPTAGYDGEFFLRSADDRFRLTIGSLMQVQARAFQRDRGRTSDFLLERMRLEIGGTVDRIYHFNIEPKFTEDEVELEEAWVGVDLSSHARLLLGRMKEPYSLEEMLPRKHMDFVNFSVLNQLAPAEDHGITLLGATAGGSFEYGAAVYNGTGGEEQNSDKDVAARLVWHPFAREKGHWLQALQIGAAGTFGRADQDAGGVSLLNEAKMPFLEFASGTRFDGDRSRVGLELGWYHGPLALLAEAILQRQRTTAASGAVEAAFRGAYVAGSWVLTGEDKTWRGVHPLRPLLGPDDATTGLGAWQLAARASRLTLDDELVAIGAVGPTGFAEAVSSFDIGVNWYASYHARLKLHVLYTLYDEPIAIGGKSFDDELALLVQAQIHF